MSKALVPVQGVRTPATTSTGVTDLLKDERRFYNILLEDYNFDAIARYINLYERVKVTKRLKAYQRLPLEERILSKILDLCIPKIRAIDEKGLDSGGNVTFNIDINPVATPAERPLKSAGSGKAKPRKKGKSIAIPTVVNPDGSVSVKISQ
jgi:hypothetical protein